MLPDQRKLFTDRQQRLCLRKDGSVPQEPVLVVCTVVLDYVQREVQDPILGTFPQLIDMLSLFLCNHLNCPCLLRLSRGVSLPTWLRFQLFHARRGAHVQLRNPTCDNVRNILHGLPAIRQAPRADIYQYR